MRERPIFTFHYVSIKTYDRCRPAHQNSYLHSTMYLLKRGQHRRHIQSHMYLHSTMYLLKRKGGVTDVRTDFDLHSTMYLLKLPDEPDELLSSVFTFHYVSIKTKCILFFHRCFLYLHSTMYLLKHTKQSAAIDKNKEIYIPLCIY